MLNLDSFLDSAEKNLQSSLEKEKEKASVTIPEVDLLTAHQRDIMFQIFNAIVVEKQNRIVLQGSAGVGKTFLVNTLIKQYYKQYCKYGIIYVTAPTNKAVAVLLNKAGTNYPYYLEYLTIHKALQLKRDINPKTGEVKFVQKIDSKNPPFRNAKLIIVDEASMLSTELKGFLDLPEYRHIPIIYVGDAKQLNPVEEEDSPVFKDPNYKIFELTEIIRQSQGNPIIDLSRNLNRIKLEENCIIEDNGYCYKRDLSELLNLLITDPNNIRYLAWTNAEVNRINSLVRKKLYGDNPNKIEVGELIILAQPYEEYWTNYELKVEKLEVKSKKFFITKNDSIEITYYLINNEVLAVHEISERDFIVKLKEIKARCVNNEISWVVWFQFAETFIKFSYLYAITTHRAQGSTYNTAIINMKDLNKNPNIKEKKRLWYTAITRASNKVIFYNPPYIENI